MGRGRFLAGLTFFGLALGSGSAGALDIYAIVLADEASFSDSGAFFYVGIEGDDLTGVQFTPPSGTTYDMWTGEESDYTYEKEFPSLNDLRDEFEEGSYLFEFNSGTSWVTLQRSFVAPPPGPPTITYPPNGGTTSPTPTIAWTICATCSTADLLEVFLEDRTDDQNELLDLAFTGPADGSITLPVPPGPIIPAPVSPPPPLESLIVGHEHLLEVWIINLHDEDYPFCDPIPETAIGGVPETGGFCYSQECSYDAAVTFVVPEPSAVLLRAAALLVLGVLAAGRRR